MRVLQFLAAFILGVLPGCIDHFGTGGTGEMVVPEHQLRDVDAVQMRNLGTTRPAETQPIVEQQDFPPPQITLSIEECRLAALQYNLDLKVELYNPSIAQTSITEEEARFESLINGGVNYAQSLSPSAGGVPGFRQWNVAPDLQYLVPLETGGFFKFDAPLNYIKQNGSTSLFNPSYTLTPNITFNQPLLRGFGFDVNAQGIRLAFYQSQQTQTLTKLEIMRVLTQVDHLYWQLYASRQLLDVRLKQHELAVAQLERARRQARAGMMTQIDVVRAESGVADQAEQIILARNDLQQRQRDLKRTLNRPDLPMNSVTEIVPGTGASALAYSLDPAMLAETALASRMEMLQIELQLAAQAATIRVAKNQLLPAVAVQYSYSHNGFANNIGEAFDQVWNHDYDGHQVGLTLQIPIGNEAAKSQLRRALLTRLQQLATKEQRVLQIRQEVFNAVDNFNTDWQRILASQKRVGLAARVLEGEIHQFELGFRTSTEVLDAQARLADAQSSLVSSITDYQISQVDLAFATGTVLGASRVHWTPK